MLRAPDQDAHGLEPQLWSPVRCRMAMTPRRDTRMIAPLQPAPLASAYRWRLALLGTSACETERQRCVPHCRAHCIILLMLKPYRRDSGRKRWSEEKRLFYAASVVAEGTGVDPHLTGGVEQTVGMHLAEFLLDRWTAQSNIADCPTSKPGAMLTLRARATMIRFNLSWHCHSIVPQIFPFAYGKENRRTKETAARPLFARPAEQSVYNRRAGFPRGISCCRKIAAPSFPVVCSAAALLVLSLPFRLFFYGILAEPAVGTAPTDVEQLPNSAAFNATMDNTTRTKKLTALRLPHAPSCRLVSLWFPLMKRHNSCCHLAHSLQKERSGTPRTISGRVFRGHGLSLSEPQASLHTPSESYDASLTSPPPQCPRNQSETLVLHPNPRRSANFAMQVHCCTSYPATVAKRTEFASPTF